MGNQVRWTLLLNESTTTNVSFHEWSSQNYKPMFCPVFWRQRRVVLWCTHTRVDLSSSTIWGSANGWGAAIIARGALPGLIFQLSKFLSYNISSPPFSYLSNSIHDGMSKCWCLVYAYQPTSSFKPCITHRKDFDHFRVLTFQTLLTWVYHI